MEETLHDTTESLLVSVQEAVEGPDLASKRRTAGQLHVAANTQTDTYMQAVLEATLDPETVEDLRELGYLGKGF